jgi:aerobic C4-dicarboxylate transport protein
VTTSTAPARSTKGRGIHALYLQVLAATLLGIIVGIAAPTIGQQCRWLGDGFIALIKMLFAPVIALSVVLGIARMHDTKELGRVGVRALIYFEVMSTFALLVGLVVVNVVKPGAGMNVDPSTLDPSSVQRYTTAARESQTLTQFILHLIPSSPIDALARNDVLQILVFSTLFGVALTRLGSLAEPVVLVMERVLQALFGMVGLVMRVAPLGAFGAMAFTVGTYGFRSMIPLATLMACMYLTCALFIIIVLGGVLRAAGFGLWAFLRYIKDELFTVIGTSSSESVIPQLMQRLEGLGISRTVVGLVVPSGLTFNPDGQCIYYTMAAVFVAQATNTPISLFDQVVLLGVLMITSKGSAGVTGSAFVTLAATLASLNRIPVAGMVLLLGVDRFMSEARAFTNTIGTAIGTVAVARWVGAVDMTRARAALSPREPEIPISDQDRDRDLTQVS